VAEFYLGLDFGSSGTRVCLIDEAGNIVHEAKFAYPDPGNQQPSLWRAALFDLLAGTPTEARSRLVAVAIDGTSGTVLLADAKGQPVGRALLYSDLRAVEEAQTIAALAPGPRDNATSGLSKFLWLLKQPGSKRARFACHQADWLAGLLTGRFGTSDYHNALKTGCNPETLSWPEWMQSLPVWPLLPRVLAPGSSVGSISAEMARRFGLDAACTVRVGTTDSIAAFIAAGVNQPGEAVTSLGSTLVLKLLSATRVDAPEYGVYSHRYGRFWLAGGASNTGGAILRQYFSDQQLAKLSRQIDPVNSSGLDYYPLPEPGERFPFNDPQFLPRLQPRPADDRAFLHGLLESMARIEALGYRRLEELGATPVKRVMTAGGGAQNETWRRIRERLMGVPVAKSAHTEAAYGAAMLAYLGTAALAG
jgi:sugar (pentulose or hexulose) kinase